MSHLQLTDTSAGVSPASHGNAEEAGDGLPQEMLAVFCGAWTSGDAWDRTHDYMLILCACTARFMYSSHSVIFNREFWVADVKTRPRENRALVTVNGLMPGGTTPTHP